MARTLSGIRVEHCAGQVPIRDLQLVPYRWTSFYRRQSEIARQQRAEMRFRVQTLWPSLRGQSTSGMMRRPRMISA